MVLRFLHDKRDSLKTKSYSKTEMIKNKFLYIHELSRSNKGQT